MKFARDIVECHRRHTVPKNIWSNGHTSGPAMAQGKGGGDGSPIGGVQPVANARQERIEWVAAGCAQICPRYPARPSWRAYFHIPLGLHRLLFLIDGNNGRPLSP